MFDFVRRQAGLRAAMEGQHLDAYFCPLSSDLEYLTGIPRSVPGYGATSFAHDWAAGALFTPEREPIVILPEFVATALRPDLKSTAVILREEDDPIRVIAKAVGATSIHRLGLSQRTWAETLLKLQHAFDCRTVDGSQIVASLRMIKSPAELEAIRRACQLVDKVMGDVVKRIRAGVTELELLHEVQYQMELRGSKAPSFETAVFSLRRGDGGRAPYTLSPEPLQDGCAVSFDFGAVVDGYCSDFGRTVFLGDPGSEARSVYDLVVAAQGAGLAAVRPGVAAATIDHEARAVIADAGYGEMFHSRVGHSIGLDTHERPFIAPHDQTPMAAGMTFTIEPSVYWPDHTGVRIEDIVLCEAAGGQKLNGYPTDMLVI